MTAATAPTLALPCLDEDPDLFFPRHPTSIDGVNQIAAALAVCRDCPVQPACLDAALRRDEADRRSQVIGGRWFDDHAEEHDRPPAVGALARLNRAEEQHRHHGENR